MYREPVRVRPLGPRDVDAVCERVVARAAAAARRCALLEGTLDREALRRAVASAAPAWVARSRGRVVGHLATALVDGSRGRAWVPPDGASFDGSAVLGALVCAAAPAWRDAGANGFSAWVYDEPAEVEAWMVCGAAPSARRGVRVLSPPPDPRTGAELALRRADFDDLEVALTLDRWGDPPGAPEPEEGERRREVTDLLEDPDVDYLVAELDGLAIAQAVVMPLAPRRGSRANAVHLSAVAVHPDWRGRGLGGHLVESVLERARVAGYAVAEVNWRTRDPRVEIFWRARGFTPTHALVEGALPPTKEVPPRSRRRGSGPRG